jgi:anti-sigma factor RsiW
LAEAEYRRANSFRLSRVLSREVIDSDDMGGSPMKIFCWVRGALIAYLDGELTPRRSHRLEAHLRGCPHCQSELQQLQQVNLLLRSLSVRSRSELYWPQAIQRLRNKLQPLPEATTSPLLAGVSGLVENLPRALLPMTLVGAALIKALAILGLEEEAVIFCASYILPLVLG